MNSLLIKGPTRKMLQRQFFKMAHSCLELTLDKCRSKKQKIAVLSMFHLKYPEFFSTKLSTLLERFKNWHYDLPEDWFRKCCPSTILLQIVFDTRRADEK